MIPEFTLPWGSPASTERAVTSATARRMPVEVIAAGWLGGVEDDESALLKPAGHIGLGQQEMVQHDHDVGGLDGGDVVYLLPGYLEGGEDRGAATLGAEGRGHDDSVVSGLERRRCEYLGRRDGALSTPAVPPYFDHTVLPICRLVNVAKVFYSFVTRRVFSLRLTGICGIPRGVTRASKEVGQSTCTSIYKKDGGVALLTINRPEALNAMNAAMLDEICEAIDRVEGDDEARCW